MAVNIDTVYQRVQAIANKEQRGYITPQEFNLLANQAQMDIFEQYFYDQNEHGRRPSNDTTYSDMLDLLEEKIDHFERYRQPVTMSTQSGEEGLGTLPSYYRLGELYYKKGADYYEIENVTQNEIHHYQRSPLTAPTTTRPMYVRHSAVTATGQTGTTLNEIPLARTIQVYPITITSNVVCNYIARPQTVNWNYTLVNGYPLYNATEGVTNGTRHFELHQSEETELVIKILALAGITLNDANLVTLAAQEDVRNETQKKQ